MANLEVKENKFVLDLDVTSSGKATKTLETAGTYVDKNIEIKVDSKAATYEVEENAVPVAVASVADNDYTTEIANGHAIVLQADATKAASTVGVATAGFAAADDTVIVPATTAEQATKTIYIKEGSLTGGTATEITSEGGVKFASSTNGFDIKAAASGSVSVNKAGWIDAGTKVNGASDTVKYLQAASLANTADNAAAFEEKTAPVLTEDGYLFINEGYIKDTKISLATLVPDDANITSENADKVYNTVKAYDKDGKLIVGTMGDAELGAITANDATATVSSVNVSANADESKFTVSGTGDISGSTSVSVSKRGLAETTLSAEGEISGTATVNAELDVIGLTASVSGDGAVKPEIKKDVSTAKSSELMAAAPEGQHYVAVSTDAIAKTATVTPTVAEAGYGTADVHVANSVNVTAGAQAADKVYIAIDNGSHEVSHTQNVTQEAITINMADAITDGYNKAGVLSAAPEGGKPYLMFSTSNTNTAGSVTSQATCVATEGYIEAGTSSDTAKTNAITATVTQAANKYIRVYNGEVAE